MGKARKALAALKAFGPVFVEEPLTGGTPVEWRSLRTEIGVPLAGDESIPNLPTLRAFAEAATKPTSRATGAFGSTRLPSRCSGRFTASCTRPQVSRSSCASCRSATADASWGCR
jgi:hypothetical protein